MTTRQADDATGVAPDGSPVELYRHLPEDGEAALIHDALPGGASILDLGCGPGRIAGPLARLGHPVVGVDNSEAMLAALPAGVDGVLGDATTIRLGRRFGAVLLTSHLLNDPTQGVAFASTAAAHVEPDGAVIGEIYPPGWNPTRAVGREARRGDASIVLERAAVDGDLLDAEVRYALGGHAWRQPFTARLLDEPGLASILAAGGLRFDRWLGRPGWFLARPTPPER